MPTRLVLRRGKIYEMRVADINANRNSGKKSNQKTNAGAVTKGSHKAAEINKEFDVKPGDVFLFFNENQAFPSIIYNGDCRDERFLEIITRFIKFGLLMIDLPYNVNYTAGGHFRAANCHALDKIANDNLSPEKYRAFVDNALAFASPYLIPGAGYFVWSGMEYTATVKTLCEQRLGEVRDEIIWIKKGLKQSNSYFKKGYKKALFGWTGRKGLRCWRLGGNDTTNVLDQRLLGKSQHDLPEPDQSGMSTVEIEDYELARSIHPCPKPVSIYKKIIEMSLEPDGAVLDSMAGSGTTVVAAQLAGCRGIGIELQSEYVAVTVKRMEKVVDRIERTTIAELSAFLSAFTSNGKGGAVTK